MADPTPPAPAPSIWTQPVAIFGGVISLVLVCILGVMVWSAVRPSPLPPGPTPEPVPDAEHPVILPENLELIVGRMFKLQGKSIGDITWIVPPSSDSKIDYHFEGNDVLLTALAVGESEIGGSTGVKSKATKPVWTKIKMKGVGPIPPIPPGPDPPIPPKPPDPPTPAPIPVPGFRVLIVYETADLPKIAVGQQAIIYGKATRDYLNAKCVMGPDNKTKEYRIYDKDVSLAGESKLWQDVMLRKMTSLPWLVVSNGISGFEGPLPSTVAEAMAIFERYAK